MHSIETDQDGNPRIYYAVGVDDSDPKKVVPVIHEIRPGGMIVVKRVPERTTTVAPDPLPAPSAKQVEEERLQRAADYAETEAAALRAERGEEEPEAEADDAEVEGDEQDEEEKAEAAARASTAKKAGATTGRSRRAPAKSR